MTLRFFKISLKKEVYWSRHFYFWWRYQKPVASKFYTNLLSQSITPSIVFISRWVLLVQISAARHVCNFRYLGVGIEISSVLTIASFLDLFPYTQRIRKNKKEKITWNFLILTQPPNYEYLLIADTFVLTRRCPLLEGFTLTWKIYVIWIESQN